MSNTKFLYQIKYLNLKNLEIEIFKLQAYFFKLFVNVMQKKNIRLVQKNINKNNNFMQCMLT